jgi:ligand-binding SRPBCC domain-containing protein
VVRDARVRHQDEALTVREYLFQAELWLPRPIHEVFGFFSDAANLEALTPEFLNFEIVTPAPIYIRMGTLIDYRLRINGFPVRWRTRISAWEPPYRFVDEQVRGPYRLWTHEHNFAEHNHGTLMRDVVRYAVPGGAIIHWLFVRGDVEAIFTFRRRKLLELFDRESTSPHRSTSAVAVKSDG